MNDTMMNHNAGAGHGAPEKTERIVSLVPMIPPLPKRKRVAAYARVSLDKDAMLHSLAAQVSYYKSLIQCKPDWEYAGVYADEGLTGTKENRPEFQRLLADCRDGKIEILSAVWIQSHDSSKNESPFEYLLKPLFRNRYKHRKRSEQLTQSVTRSIFIKDVYV